MTARAAAGPERDLIETIVASFVERYAKKQTREKTWRETERILNREIVEPWRGRRLSAIKRADVHDLLDKIVDRARRSPRIGRSLLCAECALGLSSAALSMPARATTCARRPRRRPAIAS